MIKRSPRREHGPGQQQENGISAEAFLQWEAASRDVMVVKRCYIDVAGGDLIAGILLSQVLFYYLPTHTGEQRKVTILHDGIYWLAKRREDWWEECRISAKQFDRASSALESLGILRTKLYRFNGSPTLHLAPDFPCLLRLLQSIFPKGENSISPLIGQSKPSEEKMDFTERVKSKCTKGKDGNVRKGKILNIANNIANNIAEEGKNAASAADAYACEATPVLGFLTAYEQQRTTTATAPPRTGGRTPDKQRSTAYTPGFLAFWDAYPHDRRRSKVSCFVVWQAEGLEARTAEIVEKIERLKITTWDEPPTRRTYVKTPLPWLNDQRYEDELLPLPAPTAGLSEKGLRSAYVSMKIMEDMRHDDSRRSASILSVSRRNDRDVSG